MPVPGVRQRPIRFGLRSRKFDERIDVGHIYSFHFNFYYLPTYIGYFDLINYSSGFWSYSEGGQVRARTCLSLGRRTLRPPQTTTLLAFALPSRRRGAAEAGPERPKSRAAILISEAGPGAERGRASPRRHYPTVSCAAHATRAPKC